MNRNDKETMREVYDFAGGIRGKHHEAYRQGANVVLLEPDVAEVFRNSAAVNKALRAVARLAQSSGANPGGRQR